MIARRNYEFSSENTAIIVELFGWSAKHSNNKR
jgi:hypothetical protein